MTFEGEKIQQNLGQHRGTLHAGHTGQEEINIILKVNGI